MSEEDTEQFTRVTVKHKKKPKWGNIILLSVILILIIGICGFGYHVYSSLQPVQKESEVVDFKIEENTSSKAICQNLASQGIVRDADVSYYFAKLNELTDFKAGSFQLDKSWSLEQIFTTLNDNSSSHTDANKVTIVEGDWAKDAAKKIAAATDVKADDLIALWSNKTWIESEMPKYPFLTEEMFNSNVRIYLEGYITPETYVMDAKDTTAEAITEQILDQTLAVYNKYQAQIKSSSLSIHQIYTLASIVQYEGGGDLETLKNIASVFYNRLAIDMPLQSSVTVCYAIDFDKQTDNWQACEVNSELDSPYNTYKNAGLPPGPIENPGTAALEAVLNPNQTDYLYFMAEVKTGTVYYASTYEGHLKNIADHPNN